jgi:tRNA dimethylallyltransferase
LPTLRHSDHPFRALLIAGPTASGKSALALELAAALGGTIINADSMQVYRDLAIITARPSEAEEGRTPHRLYGHVDAAKNYSTGRWCTEAAAAIGEAHAADRLPILVGGTGLYFKALTRGLARIPPIPDELRARLRRRLATEGAPALHAELAVRDRVSAQRLMPGDGVRIARALEVVLATGRPLADWQQREGAPPILAPAQALPIFLDVPHSALHARIDARFDAMLAAGALGEVAALAARDLDPALPAMKAHGVPWLLRHLRGEIDLATAAEGAKRDTRRYTKRQATWFRHQLPEFTWMSPDRALAELQCAQAR